jgi:uncharacterized protein
MKSEKKSAGLKPQKPCPICKKPSVPKFHPFCSVRCADVDLNRWLSGVYAIPVSDSEPDGPEEDPMDQGFD